MKKRFAALLLLGWLIPASMAWAEPPISVSHTLTGYTMGTDTVTLNYALNVKNTGENGISNVTLSYIPITVISNDQATQNIGNLDPQAATQVTFTLTTPMLLDQNFFHQLPLFWVCEGVVAGIDPVRFSARSIEGGAL